MQSTCIEREPVVHAVARLMAERIQHGDDKEAATFADVVHTNLADGWSFELPDDGEDEPPLRAAGLRLHDADLMLAWEEALQLVSAGR